jgi:hypothetical protein
LIQGTYFEELGTNAIATEGHTFNSTLISEVEATVMPLMKKYATMWLKAWI